MTLALLLLLAQTPDGALTAPPPPVTPTTSAAPTPVATDVDRFAAFVERNLMALDIEAFGGLAVRSNDRSWKMVDDDFATAFALVPEAKELAASAQRAMRTSAALQVAGLACTGVALVFTVIAPLTNIFLPLLIVSLGLLLPALVLVLIAAPFAVTATTNFVKAMTEYNIGLTRLRPPVGAPPPG